MPNADAFRTSQTHAPFSQRSAAIQPFHVMSILAHAQALQAQGHDVIHLEVGEPDFDAPDAVIKAGIEALKQGHTHYTPALGLPQLRAAIADFYAKQHGVAVDPRQVILAPGASGALQLLCAARLDAGEQLMLSDPGYPCNRHFARLFEAHGQCVAVGSESNYQLTPELVREHWRANTKAVLLASPSNPTGAVLTSEQLLALANTVHELGGELWVDEIYQGLVYDSERYSVLQDVPNAVVVNSFSKYFGMTGFRLGWAIVPPSWEATLDTLAQNVFLAPPTPSQYAALAAFDDATFKQLEARRFELKARRDYLVDALLALGFKIPVMPQGALYVYADASAFTQDSLTFCQQLLDDAHVAITPGVDFGEYRAHEHVRFAFTTDIQRLQEAVARLAKWLKA